jgi:hypothetical protein
MEDDEKDCDIIVTQEELDEVYDDDLYVQSLVRIRRTHKIE